MNVLMILTAFRDMLPGGTDIDFDAAGLPILPGGFVAILAAGGIVVTLTIFIVKALVEKTRETETFLRKESSIWVFCY